MDEQVVLDALSEPAARNILSAAMGHPRSVKEISDAAGVSLSTTYRHVENLVEAGLLVKTRSAISPDGKRYDLYRARVDRMGMEVSSSGVEVTWETDEDIEDRLARMWDQLRL